MPLIDIVAGVCRRRSLPVPSSVISSTDAKVQEMLALVQDEVESLRARHNWTGMLLTATPTITAAMVSGIVASIPLATDFRRFPQDTTVFHVGRRQVALGPMPDDAWQRLVIGQASASGLYWRRRGTILNVAGASAGDVISYDYLSANPVRKVDGITTAATFSADSDSPIMPEDIVRKGLLWRFLAAKGLDYAQAFEDYERELELACAEDGTANAGVSMSDSTWSMAPQLPAVFGA